MSNAVMLSIQPKWCEKIASGRKTIELRKTKPKLETPFKVYIYCTKADTPIGICFQNTYDFTCGKSYRFSKGGEVIGEFVCDGFLSHCEMANADIAEAQSLVRREKILEYAGEKEVFGWHISDLVIYDKPKELSEFYKNGTLSNEAFCETVYDGMRSYADYLFTRALRKPPQSWCYVEELSGGDS